MADILDFPLLPGAPSTKTILVCECGGDLWEVHAGGDIKCADCRNVSEVMRGFDPTTPPQGAA